MGPTSVQPKPLNITDMLNICEAYDSTIIDFEKMQSIETTVFPIIQQRYNKK